MPKINVNFEGVEDRVLVPEGDYVCKVSKVEMKKSESSGYNYISWQLKIGTGTSKGQVMFHITSLKPTALFNLRNTLIACGFKVPAKAMNVDLDQLPGKLIGITVYHEEYKGKPSAKVKDVWEPEKTDAGWGRKGATTEAEVPWEVNEVAEAETDELDI